jgi:hypothetical protein
MVVAVDRNHSRDGIVTRQGGDTNGGSGQRSAAAAAGAIPTAFSYGSSSWLAGGQAGCNY